MQNLRQLHDVDLKLLRTFCTIVEEGSFTAAQVTLNLSQSALSEYLKSLEIRLGTRLCQRGPKGFKLYREGEIVYQAARELFQSVELFKQRTAELNRGVGCELSVAVQDAIIENSQSRVTEALARFAEYYPDVTLNLEIMYGLKLARRILDGLVDVGICLDHDRLKPLSTERLFDERSDLYCGRSHPLFEVPDKELTRDRLGEAAYCHRGPFENFRSDDAEPIFQLGDVGHGAHAQLALILSGRNIGYLPQHVACDFVAAGRLRALDPEATHVVSSIVAVSARPEQESRLVRSLMDCLVDCQMEASIERCTPSRSSRGGIRHVG